MRPNALDPLFAPLSALSGVGPRMAQLFARLLDAPSGDARVIDLLFHLPHSGIDRRARPTIAQAEPGAVVTLDVTVTEHRPPPPGRSRAPFRVVVEDETGDVTLAFFNMTQARLDKMLPLGAKRLVSGKIELWDGHRQMVHPDRILAADEADTLPPVEPVYGLTEGLSARYVARIAAGALERLPSLPEWQDAAWIRAQGFPAFDAALRTLHHPLDMAPFAPEAPARRRLAYDELLATQLALALMRAQGRRRTGRSLAIDGHLADAIRSHLPFALTASQEKAVADIRADLTSPHRMVRLLQGDVGSGKTVVALLAMASAAEAGRQAALMAPTEILARQHHARLAPLAAAAGIEVGLLTGRDKGAERAKTIARLASGEMNLVVGTHALFQEGVTFQDLGFAVIDEQHRFGVHQRFALGRKGDAVDLLVMTATPIPRSLVLSYFGDMDVSILSEKPAGRKPIDTRALPLDRLDEVVDGIGRALKQGARVYWVCPLVAESETLDVAAVEERHAMLQQFFGDRVGLLHGKMAGRDKDAAMGAFQRGETRILVATTVIEVGVDVPEATIMVIEHAERFGLAQLHQLRGRVGRGAERSSCLLLYKAPLGEVAKARLGVIRETEDGFRIAEEDLKLRGEGEILGTRQSGAPDFKLARVDQDADLVAAARDDARLILEKDPKLTGPRGEALRFLLYLFERDEAIRLLRGAG
ncbi:ATP-dependent DNA helicase RecG [Chelatococcus asaccharovorans]|uniref:ATP-dependent DNA helicase RecG n=1 Tax=Chelatococcus asaccharovorans TaxID=28210 RepID=A0A2V3U3B9_9HYPH|nr:ATP-dependent DNA helicase RecG [Chelatococcus asaccharovorans]MBS7702934.1 ATP-dependent DNA helicase RecG [Chelatococcus asaccharovorans]PXW57234.1 ATP-dependent DNA helicase RecG [Chelatococcus asaccharovorans]